MDEETRPLRAEAQRRVRGTHASQVRYPDPFRRAALALARRRLGQNGSVAQVARALGVSGPALAKWLRPPGLPVLRPGAVTPAPTPEGAGVARPVLITPKGRARPGPGSHHARRRAAGARMIGSTRQVTV